MAADAPTAAAPGRRRSRVRVEGGVHLLDVFVSHEALWCEHVIRVHEAVLGGARYAGAACDDSLGASR